MLKPKYFLILLSLFFMTQISFAQSFNYSGPTSVTIPFGSSTATAGYSFSYSGLSGLYDPGLIIAVDGSVINNGLCNNPTTPSYYSVNLTQGSHTIKFSLMSVNSNTLNCYNPVIHKVVEFTVNVNFRISVENNFGGGTIYANSNTTSPARLPVSSGSNVSAAAIEQDYNGYHWIWNTSGTYNSSWIKIPSGSGSSVISYSQSTSYTVQSNDMNTRVEAGLRKVCNLSFVNNYSIIYLNGSSQSSPASANVVEQNSIYASGNSYSSNGLIGTFSHWVKDGQTYSSSITPTAHGTYTAVYTHKPSNSGEYVACNSPIGSPVTITWTDNVNTAVNQYQIWRTVKHNGVTGDPQLLATVGRGVQSYTDYEYVKTSSYVDLLRYDVRAYYSTEGTYADESWHAVYGEMGLAKKNESDLTAAAAKELPKEYAISNHPNPFNPTTTISYQLPEAGLVTIKVYDILGKEVAELVNENKQAGYYTVNFDAGKLTSGIYISTIQSGNFVQSKKMLMLK